MKLIQLLLFSLLVLPLVLFASPSKIIITKTSKKSNLRIIKHKLNTLHIRMFVQKKGSSFFIYSQNFSTLQQAQTALKRIKHSFKYAKILQKEQKKIATQTTLKHIQNKYTVNFALDMQSISGNSTSGYTLEVAYPYSKDTFITLAYQKNSSSELSTSNLYSSFNYNSTINLLDETYNIYTGGVFGYSKLDKSGFSQSASLLFGAQIGYKYSLYSYLDLYTAYQLIYVDHIIELQNNEKLQFNLIHNLEFGVSYKF